MEMAGTREAQEADAMRVAREVWPDRPKPIAPPSAAAPWHIVHCVGKSELQTTDFLKARGFLFYNPKVREMRAVPKKEQSKKQRGSGLKIMKPMLVALFPRYLFVRLDMGLPGWREIFSHAGIGGMVCEGGLPVRVPDALVEGIKTEEVDGALPGLTKARLILTIGTGVTIKEGPLSGLHGTVDGALDVAIADIDADTRIRVLVAMLGGQTPVELHISQIERPPEQPPR